MSASVRCPGCQTASEVPPELLGRTGRCNTCGRRIRLASPTAELLDPPADLATLDELGELEPVGDLLATEPAATVPLKPAAARPAEPPRAKRARAVAPPPRGPSKGAFAAVALLGLLGGGAGGALLVKYLLPPPLAASREEAAPPAAPQPANPEPKPPEPKLPPEPEPKPKPPEPEPKPKPPEPKPAPPIPAPPAVGPKVAIKLPGAATGVFAGGRYAAFQTAGGPVLVYDVEAGQPFFTVNGAKPDDLVAVARTKLFLGRAKDSLIVKFDLATGKADGQATFEGAAAGLRHLAVGSASDGPLLVVMKANDGPFLIRLLDTETFAPFNYPIDDPTEPRLRAFPFTETSIPRWVAVSADGRAVMLGNRYYRRAEDRYAGGLLPNTGSAQHLPTADAKAFVGTRLYDDAGIPIAADLPPGVSRRYLPAVGGPFVVSVEYKLADPSAVKLQLHMGANPNPLGPLPGGDEVAAWAKGEPGWVSKLHQRVVFVPDPPRLIVCPPGGDTAHAYPIDLAAMLARAGYDVTFTSTPPAEAHPGQAYAYRATTASALGPVVFALESGPPGMTVTRDGVLRWPNPDGEGKEHKVTLSATAGGKRAEQTFRLLIARRPAAK